MQVHSVEKHRPQPSQNASDEFAQAMIDGPRL